MAKHSATRCKQWIGALLVLLGLSLAISTRAAPAIVIDAAFTQIDLSEHLDILEGNAQHIDAPEQANQQFRVITTSDLTHAGQPRWLRFGIINSAPTAATLVLQLQPIAPAAGDFRVRGDAALALRPLHLTGIVREGGLYELRIPAQARGMIYLRMHRDAFINSAMKLSTLEQHLYINSQ